MGVFYVSEIDKQISIYGDSNNVITNGMSKQFQKDLFLELSGYVKNRFKTEFKPFNNVYSPIGIGFHAVYDSVYKRILLTKIDYKPLADFIPYEYDNSWQVGKYVYNTVGNVFWDSTQ